MTIKKIQCTKEGFEELKKELEVLINEKKPQTVEKLQRARSMGDLSENSAYTTARDELSLLEGRIKELEEVITNTEIIEKPIEKSEISIGNQVMVEINSGIENLHVVGEFEADPLNKKLSSTSPIGKALLGKKVGDLIEVEVPTGKIQYKILKIS